MIGVEPEGSRALDAALQAGAPVDVAVQSIAADLLGARRAGALNFAIAERFVSGVALVTDAAIVEAQRRLWSDVSIIAEPGGAAAFAALISGAYRPAKDERVGVLVCGANADLAALGLVPSRSRRCSVTRTCGKIAPAGHCDGQEPELLSARFPPGPTGLAARWGVAKW